MSKKELHLISNGKQSLEQFVDLAQQVYEYVTAIHIREKQKTARELSDWVERLIGAGVPREKIYLNDRLDVAWAAGVAGVQLAYHSLEPSVVKRRFPRFRVGRSVHSLQEAKEMESQGVDFLLFGHIYQTGSKPGLAARGIESLKEIVEAVSIPVIAIGGIKVCHIEEIIAAGASGIAVMSGIAGAEDPRGKAKEYMQAMVGE
ncbi:thiazole tautomerase TenI [Ammoniphilus resinae]|uniref:Thiazole tautomerase (Transcriptional regulator TenI) n=1 Tax=Ammoniphilus resinae TaxID=861532 RepID=A0ABS4GR36_9BACL|nr:thiazole tautomerase TenI [Ammoniphilus resinae]MBP1932735.1 thiazole tautomerase (transcriptional regulator TenI) [Ammoniphilus resinae]